MDVTVVTRCSSCRFWQPVTVLSAPEVNGGECRRTAPNPAERKDRRWAWTRHDEWCGEWAMLERAAATDHQSAA